jgi:hypothetical protein
LTVRFVPQLRPAYDDEKKENCGAYKLLIVDVIDGAYGRASEGNGGWRRDGRLQGS